MATSQKFFEIIKPGINIDFIGKQRIWIGISIAATLLSILMLPVNAYLIPGRGQMLNWSVEFKGGSEIEAGFKKPVQPAEIRDILGSAGYHGVEAVSVPSRGANYYVIRMAAVSALSRELAAKAEQTLKQTKVGEANVRSFEWSDGGDKIYVRLDQQVEIPVLIAGLKTAGINPLQVHTFGRAEDHNYEATLVSLDSEVKKALENKLGAGSVDIGQVSSVGAKAGEQLRNDGISAMLGAILLIVIYVAFRFDFRYGPGTIIALLHDAVLTMGAFAVTYKEFSLTTVAALLTIIGFSMNDTIVVFDRIREDAAKYRDRRFDRVVNTAINETLSRTILTSATVFFVTLAMNLFGTGVIRDFAFAMNVGVIVGTYSSVFIASPVLIWLNDKFAAAQKKQGQRTPERQARRPVRRPQQELQDQDDR
jgi:preprotein translocase subunit SecF